MNWYKQSQASSVSMDDIIWAIDDILLNEVLTEDDYIKIITSNLDQITAGKEQEYSLPKAAQSIRGNRKDPTEKNLLDELKNQTEVMDLSKLIGYKSLSRALNVPVESVKKACLKYSISVQEYAMKRRFYVEGIIIEFMSTLASQPMKIIEAYNLFSKKYKHNIQYKKFGLMLKYNNLISKLTDKPENIYLAFEGFIRAEHSNNEQNMETLIQNGKINQLLDKFFSYYGKQWGFETPIAKEMMSQFIMTKIQIRDKSIRNQELGQFFNQTGVDRANYGKLFSLIDQGLTPQDISKETGIAIGYVKHFYDLYQNKKPPIVDETHPSYFLNNENRFQEANNKMNWYKKANKWKDKIPGGRADGKKPSDYDKRSVEKGHLIEFEHTNDPSTAREITIDHLEEFPDYYNEEKGLPAMEKDLKKLEKTKPARSGRYPGQQQGDENRPGGAVINDIYDDNELVEGEFVKVLHRMASEGDWDSFNNYLQKLRNDGHSASRVNSMMSRAMHGVKL